MNNNNISYVCIICSQTFTRKESGKRHNKKLHSGTATIVRLIDYIIGRLSGNYLPGAPLSYRSKKNITFSPNNDHDNWSGFTILPDNTHDIARYFENVIDKLIDNKNTLDKDKSDEYKDARPHL